MPLCFFASDLHGSIGRYRSLFRAVEDEVPAAVFLGGDLLPHAGRAAGAGDFPEEFLAVEVRGLRRRLGDRFPRFFLILGNDDPRIFEPSFASAAEEGLWVYAHGKRSPWEGFEVYGYSHVPPTPFLLKDWERYDVSRYVDPGCVSPEEGRRSVAESARKIRQGTIEADLARLTEGRDLARAICLFHSPPYRTHLDRAALDGQTVEHVPLDVHVGSIAIQRFMERRQPWIGLHGHVHESTRLTGHWRDRIGRTHLFQAAHEGPELALVRFDAADPARAERELV